MRLNRVTFTHPRTDSHVIRGFPALSEELGDDPEGVPAPMGRGAADRRRNVAPRSGGTGGRQPRSPTGMREGHRVPSGYRRWPYCSA